MHLMTTSIFKWLKVMFLEYLWVAYAYFKRKKDFFSVLMQNKIEFNNTEA